MKEKIIIYQVLPRLFGNQNTNCKENGTIEENGCGKLNNFTDEVLARIHDESSINSLVHNSLDSLKSAFRILIHRYG